MAPSNEDKKITADIFIEFFKHGKQDALEFWAEQPLGPKRPNMEAVWDRVLRMVTRAPA